MIKDKTVFGTIQLAIAEKNAIKIDDIKAESRLMNDLGMDSLDLIETLMVVEDMYNVEVADDAIDKAKTVQDCVDIIQEAIERKG